MQREHAAVVDAAEPGACDTVNDFCDLPKGSDEDADLVGSLRHQFGSIQTGELSDGHQGDDAAKDHPASGVGGRPIRAAFVVGSVSRRHRHRLRHHRHRRLRHRRLRHRRLHRR